MSLIHWWPLNGDLNDYGVNNVNPTLHGTVSYLDTGKIGKTVKFSNSLYFDTPVQATNTMSFAFWVYPDSANTWCDMFSIGTNLGRIELISTTSYQYYWYQTSNGGTNLCDSGYIFTLGNQQWYHIVMTVDGINVKFYVNGELNATKVQTGQLISAMNDNLITWGRRGVSSSSVYSARYNDIRIYNHALSAKEVKEISKGLCLHYTFEDPYTEGTTNLKPWSSTITSASYANYWDVDKNDGDIAYTRSGWNTGYNGSVPNPSVGYHAHWVYLDGELVMKFPNLNSEVSQKGRWLGISGAFTIPWSAGEKYTISWEQKTDNLDLVPYGGIYYKLTSSSSNNFNDGFLQTRSTKLNVWERVSKTFTVSSSYDRAVTSATMYIYGYSSTYEGTVYIRNIQVEYKDHVTPFAAESRTTSKLFDCSGYGHDAEIINNPPYVLDSGSGKYCVDLTNNTTKGYYDLGTATLNFLTNGTVCFWAKYTDTNYKMLFGSNDAGEKYFLANTPNGSSSSGAWYSSRFSQGTAYCDGEVYNKPKCDSQWHFYAFTGVNASNWGDYKYFLCKYGNNEANAFQFHGYLADLKIYATELSADDVLLEYKRKAAIDRNGNLFTGEFVEGNNTNIDITKTAIVGCNNIVEGTDNVKFLDGYTQLEYLEFSRDSNPCCIDSGVVMYQDYSIEMGVMLNSTSNDNQFFFSDRGSSGGYFHVYIAPNRFATYQSPDCGTITVQLNQKYVFKKLGTRCFVDNIYYGESGTVERTTRTLLIGGVDNPAGSRGFYGRCYYFVITDSSNNVLRDLIPVKRNSDNVLGLYDLVNRVFYTNAGSGIFTAGPEIGKINAIYANEINEI